MQTTKWRGVNLGGWLVLEKWMTPSLFAGRGAIDESGFCEELGKDAQKVLKKHRDTFITEADFAWIAKQGLNAIRLPIGHWVFGDEAPYIATVEYVDRAFGWAEKYDLVILLDLHGAPGSQNGYKHSGHEGAVGWGDESTIARTLSVIERLAGMYGNSPALLGIELLNEPNWQVGHRRLRQFYGQAYRLIREHAGPDCLVVISDAYRPRRWRFVLPAWKYHNVALDVHLYQVYKPDDKKRDMLGHVSHVGNWAHLLRALRRQRDIIVGEWSLAIGSQALAGKSKIEIDNAHRAYALAQLAAFRHASGWFYWNYKTENGGVWSYRDCVERGILKKV